MASVFGERYGVVIHRSSQPPRTHTVAQAMATMVVMMVLTNNSFASG